MKYKIIQINDYAVVISDDEIKINDFITDNYKVWKWKDNCSLLGKKKVIATIAPYFIEGLPMLELPNQEEDVDKFYLRDLGNECFIKMKDLNPSGGIKEFIRMAVEFGYKAAQKQYSEEDMRKAFETGRNYQLTGENNFNELLQSLQKKQFPIAVELTEEEYCLPMPNIHVKKYKLKVIKWHYE